MPEKRSEKYDENDLRDTTNSLLLCILKTLEEIRDGEGQMPSRGTMASNVARS